MLAHEQKRATTSVVASSHHVALLVSDKTVLKPTHILLRKGSGYWAHVLTFHDMTGHKAAVTTTAAVTATAAGTAAATAAVA